MNDSINTDSTDAHVSNLRFIENTRVVHYLDERVIDPRDQPGYELPWQEYHEMRNRLVLVCQTLGSVGPFGECILTSDPNGPNTEDWKLGAKDPDFWILDDQLNHERHLYVEVLQRAKLTIEWLARLTQCFLPSPQWGVCIKNLRGGFAIPFPHMLLVSGSIFENCDDVAACVRSMQLNLDA